MYYLPEREAFRPAAEAAFPAPPPASLARTQRLDWLDGWRGLAILLLLAGHFTPLGQVSNLGVELFFVLSGRLMAELLIVQRQPLRQFLVRRATRIAPALAFYVAAMLVIFAGTTLLAGDGTVLLGAFAALTFWHNYLPADAVLPFFAHSWSLAVEQHSYVALAPVALVASPRQRTAAAVAALLALAALLNGVRIGEPDASAHQYTYWRSDVRSFPVLLAFALHLLIARPFGIPRRAWHVAIGPLCLTAGSAIFMVDGAPLLTFGLGSTLLACAMVSLDFAPSWLRAGLSARPIRVLGLLSFSLYLWQQFFFSIRELQNIPAVACLAGALLCAIWSYARIERPARIWLNARWG